MKPVRSIFLLLIAASPWLSCSDDSSSSLHDEHNLKHLSKETTPGATCQVGQWVATCHNQTVECYDTFPNPAIVCDYTIDQNLDYRYGQNVCKGPWIYQATKYEQQASFDQGQTKKSFTKSFSIGDDWHSYRRSCSQGSLSDDPLLRFVSGTSSE